MNTATAHQEIRDLLWEWDFIGVKEARAAAADEYDCLVGPLYNSLRDGSGTDAISNILENEIRNHFGMEPRPSLDVFVEKLTTWWPGDAAEFLGDHTPPSNDPRAALEAFENAEETYWLRGYLAPEELPAIAVAGLVAELDSRSLRILAGQTSQSAEENAELWRNALNELGRVPPPVNPFRRKAGRILEAIVSGQLEACRGAHRALWLGAAESNRLGIAAEEAPALVSALIGLRQLADRCEQRPLADREDVRSQISERANQILILLQADPG